MPIYGMSSARPRYWQGRHSPAWRVNMTVATSGFFARVKLAGWRSLSLWPSPQTDTMQPWCAHGGDGRQPPAAFGEPGSHSTWEYMLLMSASTGTALPCQPLRLPSQPGSGSYPVERTTASINCWPDPAGIGVVRLAGTETPAGELACSVTQ